jgi:hypothetical protein
MKRRSFRKFRKNQHQLVTVALIKWITNGRRGLRYADQWDCVQVRGWMEVRLERGMRNFQRAEYGGVTETWNVIQHEVIAFFLLLKALFSLRAV